MRYKIRYLILDSNLIFNYCGPAAGLHNLSPERQKLAVNQKIDKRNDIDNFYNRLEEDILQNGFIDPITVNAGFVKAPTWRRHPIEYKTRNVILSCYKMGGSRLWVAQKHNLFIPCIVNDFVDRFLEAEELTIEEEVMKKFVNKPSKVMFDLDGVYIFPKLSGEWRKDG